MNSTQPYNKSTYIDWCYVNRCTGKRNHKSTGWSYYATLSIPLAQLYRRQLILRYKHKLLIQRLK